MLRPYVLAGHKVDSCVALAPRPTAGHQTLDLGMVVRIHRGQFSSLAPRSPTEGGPMDCRVIRTTALLALLTWALEAQTPQTGFLDRRASVAGQSHHYQ